MTSAADHKLFKLQHAAAAAKAVAITSIKRAAAEQKQHRQDCTVSVDGTWQKRGHASHNGVVTVISTDTGKCLDAEVMSNICKGCHSWQGKDKTSARYLQWQADHKCLANHTGSAASMESVGATRTCALRHYMD